MLVSIRRRILRDLNSSDVKKAIGNKRPIKPNNLTLEVVKRMIEKALSLKIKIPIIDIIVIYSLFLEQYVYSL